MKNILILIFTSAAFGLSSCNDWQQKRDSKQTDMSSVFLKGEQITNANFKGIVYVKMLMEADSVNPTSVANVSFEPGARTKWHLHPGGQILLATDGVGYYQEKGEAKKVLRKGDVIKCPPNVPHWHGASVDTAFVQLAVTNRHLGSTVWLEEVSEEEYKK